MRRPRSVPGRSFAVMLMNLAAASLPVNRADWAAAMRAELGCASNGREAVQWALGCLWTGLRERLGARSLLEFRWVRWSLALWISYLIAGDLCDVALVLSYKVPHLGLGALLGHCAAGKDNQRLTPLLNAIAPWQLAACLSVCLLYFLVVVSLLKRSAYVTQLFILAATLNVALWLYELSEPLFIQAFSITDLLCDGIPRVATLLAGWVCWRSAREHMSLTP